LIAHNHLGDPLIDGILLNLRDVSERVALEEQLRHQAFHDDLTGLANRALFEDRLTLALARGRRPPQSAGG
jgi:GGDEF domain-containing protein